MLLIYIFSPVTVLFIFGKNYCRVWSVKHLSSIYSIWFSAGFCCCRSCIRKSAAPAAVHFTKIQAGWFHLLFTVRRCRSTPPNPHTQLIGKNKSLVRLVNSFFLHPFSPGILPRAGPLPEPIFPQSPHIYQKTPLHSPDSDNLCSSHDSFLQSRSAFPDCPGPDMDGAYCRSMAGCHGIP